MAGGHVDAAIGCVDSDGGHWTVKIGQNIAGAVERDIRGGEAVGDLNANVAGSTKNGAIYVG